MEKENNATVLQTVLHDWHLKNGANMAVFAGYDMPLWYPSGAKKEHLAVLTAAGLFDTSHMGLVRLDGAGARSLLQRCFSRDLEACIGRLKTPLTAGRCVYGVFLDLSGCVIDDAIVYQITDKSFMIVVNAAMGRVIAAHLRDKSTGSEQVITDLSGTIGKMDLQGPASARIMKKIIKNAEAVFSTMPYFSFKGSLDGAGSGGLVELVNGDPVLLSRTGYTGEFGFELYVEVSRTEALWEMILQAGREFSVIPCGLAARDSLRTGAVLPLSHQDIGHWPFANNPWLFALPWNEAGTDFRKEFIGSAALLQSKGSDHTVAFAGYDLRKITAGKNGRVLDDKGAEIGTILTCTTDVSIDRVDGIIVGLGGEASPGLSTGFSPRGLCCGFIKVKTPLAEGSNVVLTDGKRKITVEVRSDIRPGRTALRSIGAML